MPQVQRGICAPPSELSRMGRPADALLKDISGSREGTCRMSRPVPLHTRHTVCSPAESGARVALTSACRLHAEILEVFAARWPAVSGNTVSVPASKRIVKNRACSYTDAEDQHAESKNPPDALQAASCTVNDYGWYGEHTF